MNKIFAITLLFFGFFSVENFAQACGVGTYRVEFTAAEKVKYKLFPLTLIREGYYSKEQTDFLVESFFPNESKKSLFWLQALVVKNSIAEEFLGRYEVEDYESYADYNPKQKKGRSKNGQIIFKTVETHQHPFLFEIASKKYGKSYFLGGFLGGCVSISKIDLENQTIENFPR
jgi:hypothetical protein